MVTLRDRLFKKILGEILGEICGQIVTRLPGPEGLLAGVTRTPAM
jgi:hypothetical protein